MGYLLCFLSGSRNTASSAILTALAGDSFPNIAVTAAGTVILRILLPAVLSSLSGRDPRKTTYLNLGSSFYATSATTSATQHNAIFSELCPETRALIQSLVVRSMSEVAAMASARISLSISASWYKDHSVILFFPYLIAPKIEDLSSRRGMSAPSSTSSLLLTSRQNW